MTIDFQKILQSLAYNPKDPLVFNSGFFLIFMAVFFFFYQFIYKHKLSRVIYFTVFSLFFFYKACGFYFLLIILSAVVDFNLANWIHRIQKPTPKKLLLAFSITINLGLLAYFKYTNFFIDIINDLQSGHIHPLHLILPVGISFYTFENLSYTIDVYRGHFKPITNFLDYCFFLSFFPKLMMGPIVRASDFIPQIRHDIVLTKEDIGKGFFLILGGVFKKVIISDYIYLNYVEYIFDNPKMYSGMECLIAVYGYAMVIYCDFSGYSDIAIGIARWMGFKIPMNFNLPYQSSSITEFWRRWHISLSSWLRDYLYISLGGNRKGKFRQYINLMLTMLLGGLWHGASWQFVFWGGMHGIALALDKAWTTFIKIKKTIFTRIVGIIITFHFVCFCWIFFKASTFSDAIIILQQIFTNFNGKAFGALIRGYDTVLIMLIIGYVVHFIPQWIEKRMEQKFINLHTVGRIIVFLIFIWIVIQIKSADQMLPIYLQF